MFSNLKEAYQIIMYFSFTVLNVFSKIIKYILKYLQAINKILDFIIEMDRFLNNVSIVWVSLSISIVGRFWNFSS